MDIPMDDKIFYRITEDHPFVPEKLFNVAEALLALKGPIDRMRNLNTGGGVPSSKSLTVQLSVKYQLYLMENIKGFDTIPSRSGRWWDIPSAPLPDLYIARDHSKREEDPKNIKVLFPMLHTAIESFKTSREFKVTLYYYPWPSIEHNDAALLTVFFRDVHVFNLGESADICGQEIRRFWQVDPKSE